MWQKWHCDTNDSMTQMTLWHKCHRDPNDTMTQITTWHKWHHDTNVTMIQMTLWHEWHHDTNETMKQMTPWHKWCSWRHGSLHLWCSCLFLKSFSMHPRGGPIPRKIKLSNFLGQTWSKPLVHWFFCPYVPNRNKSIIDAKTRAFMNIICVMVSFVSRGWAM